MIYGTPGHFTFQKMEWCEAARNGLRDTYFDNEQMIVDGVKSGRMELFLVNDNAWLVTEIMHGMLFIWCYQTHGRGSTLVQLIDKLKIVARHNKLTQISFFTRLHAALRALRRYHPTALPTKVQGETQYVIEVDHVEAAT